MTRRRVAGSLWVLGASVLWGTTGTATAQAPLVSPLALGAAAMGLGGLLRAATEGRAVLAHRAALRSQRLTLAISAVAVGVYPLAFYSSMRLAGVAVGTVVSIGSAPAVAAVVERLADRHRLSRRWSLGAMIGAVGVVALAAGRAGLAGAASGQAHQLLGILAGLLAGMTYAIYSWGAARLMRTPRLVPSWERSSDSAAYCCCLSWSPREPPSSTPLTTWQWPPTRTQGRPAVSTTTGSQPATSLPDGVSGLSQPGSAKGLLGLAVLAPPRHPSAAAARDLPAGQPLPR